MASKELLESHEDRLQALQEDITTVKSDVARVEVRVENLGDQFRQGQESLSKEINTGFLAIHEILDPLKSKLSDHDKHLSEIATQQAVRSVEEGKRVARWKTVTGVLVAVIVAALGAFAKTGVEHLLDKGGP